MIGLYRVLLRFYPADFQREYGAEMTAAFVDAERAAREKMLSLRLRFYAREIAGMLTGAFGEQFRFFEDVTFSVGRYPMSSAFRFPKSVLVLMCIILAGVILAIEKAAAVAASLPASHPLVPPIHSMPPVFPQVAVLLLAPTVPVAIAAWAVLFALKRSGAHRLAALEIQPGEK
jgi:hypothetical protein